MQEGRVDSYRLTDSRRRLVVEVSTDRPVNPARLLIDGELVDQKRCWRHSDRLRTGDIAVAASGWWTGRVVSCALLQNFQ